MEVDDALQDLEAELSAILDEEQNSQLAVSAAAEEDADLATLPERPTAAATSSSEPGPGPSLTDRVPSSTRPVKSAPA
jgi:hypothetical protein